MPSGIEHPSHTSSIWLVGNERQDVDRLEQTSVFLQATMDKVLAVEGLQFVHEEYRRHGSVFEGRGDPVHIIPAAHDQVPLDGWPTKEGF